MTGKLTKTPEELAALVEPQCDNVASVVIQSVVQIADDRPNWHAAFTMADNDAAPAIAHKS